MSDPWIIYAGCVLIGIVFGGGAGFSGAKLYKQLDDVENWGPVRDALTVAAIWVLAVALSGGAGAAYGYESATMGNSWVVGALWGAAGGIIAPVAFKPLRSAAVRAGQAAIAKLPNKGKEG